VVYYKISFVASLKIQSQGENMRNLKAKFMILFYHIAPIVMSAVLFSWQGLLCILLIDALLFGLASLFQTTALSIPGITLLSLIGAAEIFLIILGVGWPGAIIYGGAYLLICFLIY